MTFPGPRVMQGDVVRIVTDTASMTFTGTITSQGVVRAGRGFVELTLPDADPQQRRNLEQAQQGYEYWLYRDGALLYSSPPLKLNEIGRARDGALVVTGSP